MSLRQWYELMGNQKPKPKVPPPTASPTGGFPASAGKKFNSFQFGWAAPTFLKPSVSNECGECLAEGVPSMAHWPPHVQKAMLGYSLCPHQLRWTDAWTKLPLASKGIRLVGPKAVSYGNPSLIYALLYVGSQWAAAGGKEIRVYAISTKDPIKTYVDNAEKTWWFSHMAGIDLGMKDLLKEYLRPGASTNAVKGVLENRMISSPSSPYMPSSYFQFDSVEDQAHVGGHSVDFQEFTGTRTNLALLRAIGRAKPIASAYIWNAVAAADTHHFIQPPSKHPSEFHWVLPPGSPLHVVLQSAGDSWKPIWNEYGRTVWGQLCQQLGVYLLQTKGYSWKWQSWGQYYSKDPLQ